MKKLLLAAATSGTLALAALASVGSAEAKGFGHKGHGFHHGHGHYGHNHWGHRHFGHRHFGYRHHGYGWGYGVRTVGVYSGGSCWRYRWTSFGYKYVNVCSRPLYY